MDPLSAFILGLIVAVVVVIVVVAIYGAIVRALRDYGNPQLDKFEVTPNVLCPSEPGEPSSCVLLIHYVFSGLGSDSTVRCVLKPPLGSQTEDITLSTQAAFEGALAASTTNFRGGPGQYGVEVSTERFNRASRSVFLLDRDSVFTHRGNSQPSITPQPVASFTDGIVLGDTQLVRDDAELKELPLYRFCKGVSLTGVALFVQAQAVTQEARQAFGDSVQVSGVRATVQVNDSPAISLTEGGESNLANPVGLGAGVVLRLTILPPDGHAVWPAGMALAWSLRLRVACPD